VSAYAFAPPRRSGASWSVGLLASSEPDRDVELSGAILLPHRPGVIMRKSSLLLQVSQAIGLLLVCAIGFGCAQYGPRVIACVQNIYRVQTPAERREAAAKSMMQYVTSPKFEISEEMRNAIGGRQSEFDAAQRIGESYRMPPPRGP